MEFWKKPWPPYSQLIPVKGSFKAGATEEILFTTVPFEKTDCSDDFVVLTTMNKGTGKISTTENSRKRRGASDFTIDDTLNPTITNVMPKMGGTLGGTTVTISGTGFGSVVDDASVTIMDTPCDVHTVSDTVIICVTNGMPRGYAQIKVRSTIFQFFSQYFSSLSE